MARLALPRRSRRVLRQGNVEALVSYARASVIYDPRVAAIVSRFPLHTLFDNLRQVADDKYRGPCPFHAGDNRNGFGVERYKGEWKWRCFTGDCGGGSAIDVVQRRDGCSFREALDILDGGESPTIDAHRGGNATGRVGVTGRDGLGDPGRPSPGSLLICDACRDERVVIEPRNYGGGTRVKWTSTVELEATSRGWELAAGVNAAVGPRCLARMA